jgi:hypothetical protein
VTDGAPASVSPLVTPIVKLPPGMREKPVGVDWPNAAPPNKQRAIAPIKER